MPFKVEKREEGGEGKEGRERVGRATDVESSPIWAESESAQSPLATITPVAFSD